MEGGREKMKEGKREWREGGREGGKGKKKKFFLKIESQSVIENNI